MTCIKDRGRLMTLFQELTPMQRSLRDQSIIIIRPKNATCLKSTDNPRDRLQLRS